MIPSTPRLTTPDSTLLERMGALHYEAEVIIFDRHAMRNYADRIFKLPYALIAFVDRGEADVQVEDSPYHVATGDHLLLLLGQPTRVLKMSDDFHARFVLISEEFIRYITTDDSYYFIQLIRNTPVVHLQPYVMNSFCACYDLIQATIQQEENPYRRQMLLHIVKTYIYGVVGHMQSRVHLSGSREEEIAYLFMDLVDQHYRDHHELGFYAEHMRLSAKYISRCVNRTTSKNALSIIAQRILGQAKTLLQNPQNTVAQVGYSLGFSDPSAFGKFFRTHEHMGPREYRRTVIPGE